MRIMWTDRASAAVGGPSDTLSGLALFRASGADGDYIRSSFVLISDERVDLTVELRVGNGGAYFTVDLA